MADIPLVSRRVELINTLAVWSNIKVRILVVYNRETDEIETEIERLDK